MAEETQRVNGVSRDLMKRNHFSNEREEAAADDNDDDGGEVELSLGLSMNGRFGVDPSSKKLRRSSSVSNLFLVGAAAAAGGGGSVQAREEAREGHASLGRTCSLPAETEEWRRSREIQSARCMEARKKRMEKLKNVRVGKEVQQYENNNNSSEEEDAAVNGNVNNNCFHENLNFVQSSPQGSIGSSGGSAGGSSSGVGVPNFQTQLMIGGGRHNNPPEQGAGPAARGGGRQNNPPEQGAVPAARGGGNDELVKNALLDMPYVSTRGFAPHFNKIEGFLYRYKKGEEVKIVCVCHGLFLSPAEFVKHGGGGDVAQPLKHIVVNPFPLF
ncbi:hypothetical protein ACP275_11G116900 [Erythranthe tilingii]